VVSGTEKRLKRVWPGADLVTWSSPSSLQKNRKKGSANEVRRGVRPGGAGGVFRRETQERSGEGSKRRGTSEEHKLEGGQTASSGPVRLYGTSRKEKSRERNIHVTAAVSTRTKRGLEETTSFRKRVRGGKGEEAADKNRGPRVRYHLGTRALETG